MRVNVDITNANIKGSGIAVFENEILSRLSQVEDFQLRGCINFQRAFKKNDFEKMPFEVKYSWIPYKLVYNYKTPISYEYMMGKAAVNLFCAYTTPKVKYKSPTVVTIHDLILQKAQSEKKEIIEEYDNKVRHSIKVASEILTVSEASKKDLIEFYNLPPEKITVVYNGVDYDVFNKRVSDEKKKDVRIKYGLPEKFVMYFGGIRKHKNLERLIKAYSLLPIDIRKEYKLVITKKNIELQELANSLHVDNDVVFTGFIDDNDKVCLYQMAEVMLFVSLYEGFGIPIIEAMAAGTPVITSNTSSMPEAAGDAGILVDPYSEEEIAFELQRLIEDKEIRQKQIEMGYIQSAKFDWNNSARVVSDVLRKYR